MRIHSQSDCEYTCAVRIFCVYKEIIQPQYKSTPWRGFSKDRVAMSLVPNLVHFGPRQKVLGKTFFRFLDHRRVPSNFGRKKPKINILSSHHVFRMQESPRMRFYVILLSLQHKNAFTGQSLQISHDKSVPRDFFSFCCTSRPITFFWVAGLR